MEKSIIIFLVLITSVFAEVIDRGGHLEKKRLQSLDTITETIQKQSAVRVLIVFLHAEEQVHITRLSSSYAIELNYSDDSRWVLAVLSPSGEIRMSTSEELTPWFSEAHLRSFISGTKHDILSKGIDYGAELLLLNIADIIAQNESIEFNDLFVVSEIEGSAGISPYAWLLVIPLVFAFKKRRKKKTKPETRSLFGESLDKDSQVLFGISLQNGNNHEKRA